PRAITNRMWSAFFGIGFVNPVDDFTELKDPLKAPVNPELLESLAKRFKQDNYDLKNLIRWICNSEAYQLSSTTNRTNDRPQPGLAFCRMKLRLMTPDQLFDSLQVATQVETASREDTQRRAARDAWVGELITSCNDDEGN